MFYDYVHKIDQLITSDDVGKWCQIPYYNHPNGCPNYNKKDTCPPKQKQIGKIFVLDKPLYLVNSEFDLFSHVNRMKQKHPEWSKQQCKCVLYWQSQSRKQLKIQVDLAQNELKTNFVTYCPEAMGVNIYATGILNGLKLEKIKDLKICRHVAIIGTKLPSLIIKRRRFKYDKKK